MQKAKSFTISKHLVMKAWMHIKSNGGSAGIDKQSIEDFEKNLKEYGQEQRFCERLWLKCPCLLDPHLFHLFYCCQYQKLYIY